MNDLKREKKEGVLQFNIKKNQKAEKEQKRLKKRTTTLYSRLRQRVNKAKDNSKIPCSLKKRFTAIHFWV